MSGDRNPLHVDPYIAPATGYDRPILHGLCTYGIAYHQMVALACEGEPARLRSLACRLTSVVFPGETLRTEGWREAGSALFRVSVPARDVVVLDAGHADIDD